MKGLFTILFLLAALCSYAGESNTGQLNFVNAEWKNNSDGVLLAAKADFSGNKTFDDWIATHLMLVEQTLRNRQVNHLSNRQRQNRAMLLDELNAYWHSRAFPVNDYLSYKNPVFIDRKGNYCAVGYLMKVSGAQSLAHAIDAENKFAYIHEIKTKGVNAWAEKNGFTIDELAWIQPGYPVAFVVDDLSGGLNGTVNTMVVDPGSQNIYAGGSFTSSTKGAVCNNVAAYISGIAGWDWVSLGDGLNGTVKALLLHNNKLYVGGEFTMAGTLPVSNVAVFDLYTGQWGAMGALDSTVNTLVVYNNEIYAGGKFTGYVSKWTGSSWQDVTSGFFSGEGVRTLEVWNSTLYIGGNFELPTGAIRRHVATFDGTTMGISGFGTLTPVNDFEVHDDTLYAACDFYQGTDTCALARLETYGWERVLNPSTGSMSYFDGTSINHLLSADQKLFCAGTFFCSSGLQYGNNLMEFRIDNGSPLCIPQMIIDSGIQTMAQYGNSICIGGRFVNSLSDSLNHVGILPDVLTTIDKTPISTNGTLDVFPNPASDIITINLKNISYENGYSIKILDATGRSVYHQTASGNLFSIDLSSKKLNGVFFVQVLNGKGDLLATDKVVLQ